MYSEKLFLAPFSLYTHIHISSMSVLIGMQPMLETPDMLSEHL